MVELLIKGAKNLTAVKSGGTSDPFVKGWDAPLGQKRDFLGWVGLMGWTWEHAESFTFFCVRCYPLSGESISETILMRNKTGMVCHFRLITPSWVWKLTLHGSVIAQFLTLAFNPPANLKQTVFTIGFKISVDSLSGQLPLKIKRQQVQAGTPSFASPLQPFLMGSLSSGYGK